MSYVVQFIVFLILGATLLFVRPFVTNKLDTESFFVWLFINVCFLSVMLVCFYMAGICMRKIFI